VPYVYRKKGKDGGETGAWYIGYRNESGRSVQLATKARTKAEARQLAFDLERKSERVRMGVDAMAPEAILFRVAAARYLSEVASALDSYPMIEGRFRNHLLPVFGEMALHRVLPADIEAFSNSQKRAGYSEQTRKHLRNHLLAFFSWAIERAGLMTGANPAQRTKAVRVPKKAPKYLELDEIARVLSVVPDRYRGLSAVSLYTGLRKGELFALKVSSVRLEQRTILVGGSHAATTTKGRAERVVPIPEQLVPYLKAELGRVRSEFLFPGLRGGQMPQWTKLHLVVRRALVGAGIVDGWDHRCRRKGCGYVERRADNALGRCPDCGFALWPVAVPRAFAFKDLRSTFATHALDATGDLRFVQRALGHSDPKLTESTYAANRVEQMLTQSKKIAYPQLTDTKPLGGGNTMETGKGAEVLALAECGISDSNRWPLAPEANAEGMHRLAQDRTGAHGEGGAYGAEFSASAPLRTEAHPKTYPGRTAALSVVEGGQLLTAVQVAKLLQLSRDTVYKMAARGELVSVRFGASVRFRAEDLPGGGK
jgi:integrase